MATSPSQPQAKSRKGGPTPTSTTRTSTVATPSSGFTQGQGASTGRDNSSIFEHANEEFHHFMPAEIVSAISMNSIVHYHCQDTSYTGDVSDNDFEDARQFRNDSAVGRMEEVVQDKSKAKVFFPIVFLITTILIVSTSTRWICIPTKSPPRSTSRWSRTKPNRTQPLLGLGRRWHLV